MMESVWKHTPGQTAELWRKIEALEAENAELKAMLKPLLAIAMRARQVLDMPNSDENTADIILQVMLDKFEALEAKDAALKTSLEAARYEAQQYRRLLIKAFPTIQHMALAMLFDDVLGTTVTMGGDLPTLNDD